MKDASYFPRINGPSVNMAYKRTSYYSRGGTSSLPLHFL